MSLDRAGLAILAKHPCRLLSLVLFKGRS